MDFKHKPCNICGSYNTQLVGRRFPKNGNTDLATIIVRCKNCSFIYPNPMPIRDFDQIQKDFAKPAEYFPSKSEARFGAFENLINQIEIMKPDKGHILDVGCGRGEFLYVAGKHGWACVGTDVSDTFVAYAKEKFDVDARVGDLKDVTLPKGNFDVITLVSVIQYVNDPMGTLKRCYELLKPDGLLYLEVTNDDALIFKFSDIIETFRRKTRATTRLSPLFPSFQIYGFNKRALKQALVGAGLSVIDLKVAGHAGGGRLQGKGGFTRLADIARKAIIFIGGACGNGHLIFCVAKKA